MVKQPGCTTRATFEMLEPCAGKLACTVLRGRSGREAGELPGALNLRYRGGGDM